MNRWCMNDGNLLTTTLFILKYHYGSTIKLWVVDKNWDKHQIATLNYTNAYNIFSPLHNLNISHGLYATLMNTKPIFDGDIEQVYGSLDAALIRETDGYNEVFYLVDKAVNVVLVMDCTIETMCKWDMKDFNFEINEMLDKACKEHDVNNPLHYSWQWVNNEATKLEFKLLDVGSDDYVVPRVNYFNNQFLKSPYNKFTILHSDFDFNLSDFNVVSDPIKKETQTVSISNYLMDLKNLKVPDIVKDSILNFVCKNQHHTAYAKQEADNGVMELIIVRFNNINLPLTRSDVISIEEEQLTFVKGKLTIIQRTFIVNT